MKILAPERVWMLRGNHESRALQEEFTFKSEVMQKFPGAAGPKIFQAFNRMFEVMPLAAVIDESIYCAHGGIPSCAKKLDQIFTIQSPLREPDDNPIAMEILWNDPITDREYTELLANNSEVTSSSPNADSGFLFNTKPGTGSYYSETKAMGTFLKENGLTHIIRAHECIPSGFQYHKGGRCLTIFSCSHYCGGINEAAVALVNDSQIRVIKVDTPHEN